MCFFVVKMRDYEIKYKLILEGTGLQSGANKFEVDRKIRNIIKDTLMIELEKQSGFSSLFKDGDFDIKLEIMDYKNKEEKVK